MKDLENQGNHGISFAAAQPAFMDNDKVKQHDNDENRKTVLYGQSIFSADR